MKKFDLKNFEEFNLTDKKMNNFSRFRKKIPAFAAVYGKICFLEKFPEILHVQNELVT